MANNEQYYKKTIEALTKYIQENKIVPTEKIWNQIAINEGYLTSPSISYISGTKFIELSKKIYKQMKKDGKGEQ